MIWLSVDSTHNEINVYFDVRHVEFDVTKSTHTIVVRGLLGDGCCENWGEVTLGTEEKAQVLAVWDESGNIECLRSDIDETVLSEEMIAAAKFFLNEQFSGLDSGVREPHVLDWHEATLEDNQIAA